MRHLLALFLLTATVRFAAGCSASTHDTCVSICQSCPQQTCIVGTGSPPQCTEKTLSAAECEDQCGGYGKHRCVNESTRRVLEILPQLGAPASTARVPMFLRESIDAAEGDSGLASRLGRGKAPSPHELFGFELEVRAYLVVQLAVDGV